MNAISTATANGSGQARDDARARAADVAQQFESHFAKYLVRGLRDSADLGGAAGAGLFGDGPGASTYEQWFDDRLADAISGDGDLGIRDLLMREFERHGELGDVAPPAPTTDLDHIPTAPPTIHGGFDVLA